MPDSPLPIRVAQAIGITATSAIAGASFSLSAFVVPRILESPSPLLLKQWKHTFETGKASIIPLAGLCASSFWYLAYEANRTPSSVPYKWKIYLLSGLLTAGIVPYTFLIMSTTNKKLMDKAEETSMLSATDEIVEVGLGPESAHQLVDKWATMNAGRSLMLAIAAALSTWIVLD